MTKDSNPSVSIFKTFGKGLLKKYESRLVDFFLLDLLLKSILPRYLF